jgi:hypothetical protein
MYRTALPPPCDFYAIQFGDTLTNADVGGYGIVAANHLVVVFTILQPVNVIGIIDPSKAYVEVMVKVHASSSDSQPKTGRDSITISTNTWIEAIHVLCSFLLSYATS